MGDELDAIAAKFGAPPPRALTAAPDLAAKFGAAPPSTAAAPPPQDELDAIAARYQQPAPAPEAPKEGRLAHFGKGLSALASSIRHPIDTATNPSKRRELLRGVDDMVTLGYGQELANYIGEKFGDTPATSLAGTAPGDAAAAPGYRTAGSLTGAALPGAVSHVAKETSAFLGGLTSGVKAATPLAGAGLGAAKGAIGYAASAAPLAGLSASAEGHRLEATKEAALDPVGIGISAALGGIGGAAKGPVSKFIDRSKERQSEGVLREIAAGDETHGAATKTARMLLKKDKADIIMTVGEDQELARAVGAPAVEAQPVVKAKLEHWGSQLDPLYDIKDAATGGVSMKDFVRYWDSKAHELGKDSFNEKYVEAAHDARDSVLRARAPELYKMLQTEEASHPAIRNRILDAYDEKVPTQAIRKDVTRLQTRGSQVINPMNPGEASIMKADLAHMMFEFLDRDLEAAGRASPEVRAAVDQIREVNKRYSALSNINKAIEQRGLKEQTGGKSATKIATDVISHGGAGMALLHGNIPLAIGSYAAGKILPPAIRAGEVAANRGLAHLSESTSRFARFGRDALELQSPTRIGQQAAIGQGIDDR